MAQNRRVNPKTFFGELKRRNVYKVAVAYIVAGWALAQGLAQVLAGFRCSELGHSAACRAHRTLVCRLRSVWPGRSS